MAIIQNIIEYYDELYPITEAQRQFYDALIEQYSAPVRFLRVECASGLFESQLARKGHDVTGIESIQELVHIANLRRRNQLMAIRFFHMSYLDMTRFLGKGFYHVISCLDDRIVFIHDRTLLRKFFFDCQQLLTDGGVCVLGLHNYDVFNTVPMTMLPTRESVRAKLFSEIWTKENGKKYLVQNVETGTGKMLPVRGNVPMYPLVAAEIKDFAKEAGFQAVDFYVDFSRAIFTGAENTVLAILHT